MHTQLTVSVATLYGFLVVLTRVAATFLFAPLPQLRNSPAAARVVLSLALTVALQSVWPSVPVSLNGGLTEVWLLLERMAAEAGYGIAIGLGGALLGGVFTLSMQTVGIQ